MSDMIALYNDPWAGVPSMIDSISQTRQHHGGDEGQRQDPPLGSAAAPTLRTNGSTSGGGGWLDPELRRLLDSAGSMYNRHRRDQPVRDGGGGTGTGTQDGSDSGGGTAPAGGGGGLRRLAPPQTGLLRGLHRDLSEVLAAAAASHSGGGGGGCSGGAVASAPRVEPIAEVDEELSRLLDSKTSVSSGNAGETRSATGSGEASEPGGGGGGGGRACSAQEEREQAWERRRQTSSLTTTWPGTVEPCDPELMILVDTDYSPFTNSQVAPEPELDLHPPSPPLVSPPPEDELFEPNYRQQGRREDEEDAAAFLGKGEDPALVSDDPGSESDPRFTQQGAHGKEGAVGQPPRRPAPGAVSRLEELRAAGDLAAAAAAAARTRSDAARGGGGVSGHSNSRIRRLSTRSRVHALLGTFPPGAQRPPAASAPHGASRLGEGVGACGPPPQGPRTGTTAVDAEMSAVAGAAVGAGGRVSCLGVSGGDDGGSGERASGYGSGGGDMRSPWTEAGGAAEGVEEAGAGGGRWYQVHLRLVMPKSAEHALPAATTQPTATPAAAATATSTVAAAATGVAAAAGAVAAPRAAAAPAAQAASEPPPPPEPLLVLTAYDVDDVVRAAKAAEAELAARAAREERLETLLSNQHKLLESMFPRQAIEHMCRVIAAKGRSGNALAQSRGSSFRRSSVVAAVQAGGAGADGSAPASRHATPPATRPSRTGVQPPLEAAAAAAANGALPKLPNGPRRRSIERPRNSSRLSLLPQGPVSRSETNALPPPIQLPLPRRSQVAGPGTTTTSLSGGAAGPTSLSGAAGAAQGDGSAGAGAGACAAIIVGDGFERSSLGDADGDGAAAAASSFAAAAAAAAAATSASPTAEHEHGDQQEEEEEEGDDRGSGGSLGLGSGLGLSDSAPLASAHKHVTVLFADIVGFTSMCKCLEPIQVMNFLNDLFTRFDTLCDIYGVYKVETIGDCFMAVGGLITVDEEGFKAVRRDGSEDELHAVKVMSFAKALQREVAALRMPHNGQPLRLRVGLHSGPVTAGIVGAKMPRFCLFGDTVNTASRMESTCEPGAVHASGATAALLREEAWSPTGGVQVKGKGEMQTFLWRPPAVGNNKTAAAASVAAAVAGGLSGIGGIASWRFGGARPGPEIGGSSGGGGGALRTSGNGVARSSVSDGEVVRQQVALLLRQSLTGAQPAAAAGAGNGGTGPGTAPGADGGGGGADNRSGSLPQAPLSLVSGSVAPAPAATNAAKRMQLQ